ncbi:MAG: reductive dehalogenase [Eubacteriales bacterium]
MSEYKDESQEQASNQKKNAKNIDRREFLVKSLGLGAAAIGGSFLGVNALGGAKSAIAEGESDSNEADSLDIKSQSEMPVKISDDYVRMEQKNIIFARGSAGDPIVAPHYGAFAQKTMGIIPPSDEAGFTQKDRALERAGWAMMDYAAPRNSAGIRDIGVYSWHDFKPVETKWDFKDSVEASDTVKRAASFLGADDVGITEFDERWVYNNFFNYTTKESEYEDFPFKVTNVIAMVYEMDYDAFRTAPTLIESAGAGYCYSRMAETGHKVATFIRKLGYNAIACGNCTALSVPIAIQAGLGEIGRNGLLIHPRFGPRVRINKIFTDLPMQIDKPITFGVREFCKSCKKCAIACPSQAISYDDEPSMSGPTISNCNGVEKWYIDPEKCVQSWGEFGGDCGSCIASCPYNKLEVWNHELSKLMTRTPARPILKKFDDLFGYGKTYNTKEITKFWEL